MRALIILLMMCSSALSHDWYPVGCCSGKDCAPVKNVIESKNGYVITVKKGEHPMVYYDREFFVPYGKEDFSPDGQYHLCISMTGEVLCFFAGAKGS